MNTNDEILGVHREVNSSIFIIYNILLCRAKIFGKKRGRIKNIIYKI